jgi:hypothetical protein
MEEVVEQLTDLFNVYVVWDIPWPFHNGTAPLRVTPSELEEILFSDDLRLLLELSLPLSFGSSPRTRKPPLISYEEFEPLLDSFIYHMNKEKWGVSVSATQTLFIRGFRRRRITFTSDKARLRWMLNLVDIVALSCPNQTPFQEKHAGAEDYEGDDAAALATIQDPSHSEEAPPPTTQIDVYNQGPDDFVMSLNPDPERPDPVLLALPDDPPKYSESGERDDSDSSSEHLILKTNPV